MSMAVPNDQIKKNKQEKNTKKQKKQTLSPNPKEVVTSKTHCKAIVINLLP